ncbi:MAG: 50S ribosomal protein L5 [Planctomycetes bacterium]|nr:50S ribosomal protein L5 [Planctomycetota bacterium]
MTRLLERYRERVVPSLKEKLGRTNVHSLPKLEKIIVSMGVGAAIQDRKRLEEAVEHLGRLTGQRPQITRARRAISSFRLREGMEVGCRVTLRGHRMYEFLDRLISLALPRVRDFRGLNPKAFDGRGNYSLGLNEQLVFPEVDPDKVTHIQGMNITLVTTAKTDDEGRELLRELGMPLRTE